MYNFVSYSSENGTLVFKDVGVLIIVVGCTFY